MNGAVYESGNVFFKLKYAKTYEGVLATPMTVRDVALGELTYTLHPRRRLLGRVRHGDARDGR